MATKQEKWQEIANRGLQDQFDPQTRAKFDEKYFIIRFSRTIFNNTLQKYT